MFRLGYLLDRVSLQNACALYFFLAPVFLDRQNAAVVPWLFGAGHLISGTILVLGVSELLIRFSDRVSFRWVHALMILVAVFALFSVAVNTPGNFLHPGLWYTKYLKILLPLACVFIMARIWDLRDVPRLYALIAAFTLLSLLMLVQEFAVSGFGLARLGKKMFLFDDPNKFAVVLNVFYGALFPKFLDALRRKKPAAILGAACMLVFAALFVLQTRSGMFTCLVLSVICVLATRSRKVILYSILASVPVVAFFALSVVVRAEGAEGIADSDMSRIFTYMVGFNIIRDRPLLGVGFANILKAYDRYGGIYLHLLNGPMAIHNAALEIFAEQGVFGALTFLAASLTPIVLLIKRIMAARARYPVVELAALAIPLSFFCYGLFYHNYLADDHFWIYMAIPLIVLRSKIPPDFELKLPHPRLV